MSGRYASTYVGAAVAEFGDARVEMDALAILPVTMLTLAAVIFMRCSACPMPGTTRVTASGNGTGSGAEGLGDQGDAAAPGGDLALSSAALAVAA
jgi:hypothetical protein